mmetsp:Transcript_84363/g.149158  ORF Transcript_84363/g.149158 Transcript_84363/m.149158 type:complete len:233 (+) Transcript_84363:706-1404(+)
MNCWKYFWEPKRTSGASSFLSTISRRSSSLRRAWNLNSLKRSSNGTSNFSFRWMTSKVRVDITLVGCRFPSLSTRTLAPKMSAALLFRDSTVSLTSFKVACSIPSSCSSPLLVLCECLLPSGPKLSGKLSIDGPPSNGSAVVVESPGRGDGEPDLGESPPPLLLRRLKVHSPSMRCIDFLSSKVGLYFWVEIEVVTLAISSTLGNFWQATSSGTSKSSLCLNLLGEASEGRS